MRHAPIGDRMVALFGLGALAFSPPLIAIFAAPHLLAGIPLLYLYLFGAWAALIVLLTIAIGLRGDEQAAPPEPPSEG